MQKDDTKAVHPQIAQMAADVRDRQTHAIIGAALEVHRQLGPGFLEAVYQEALAIEFSARSIPFVREMELPVYYKGERLACSYRADFACYNAVIVELKALKVITGVEEAQLLNYRIMPFPKNHRPREVSLRGVQSRVPRESNLSWMFGDCHGLTPSQ